MRNIALVLMLAFAVLIPSGAGAASGGESAHQRALKAIYARIIRDYFA